MGLYFIFRDSGFGARAHVAGGVALILCWLFALQELLEWRIAVLKKKSLLRGTNQYWGDTWNRLDLPSYMLLTGIICYDFSVDGPSSPNTLVALAVVMLSTKLLYLMQAYTSLVTMVLQVVRDMASFSMLMLIFLVTFALAFFVLAQRCTPGSNMGSEFGGWTAIMRSFAMMFGDFDLEYLNDEDCVQTAPMSMACFILYMMLVAIVLLNLLIAIISDSFDIVNEKRKAEFLRNRAKLIITHEEVLAWFKRPPSCGWTHVLVRASERVQGGMDSNDAPTADDGFASRMKVLKAKMAAKVGAVEAKVDTVVGELSTIKGMLEQLLKRQTD